MLEKLSDAHVTVICKRQCQSLDEKLAAFELISATEPGLPLWDPTDRVSHGGDLYLQTGFPTFREGKSSSSRSACAPQLLMEADVDQLRSLSPCLGRTAAKGISLRSTVGGTPGGPLEHRFSSASGQSGSSAQSSWGSVRGPLSGCTHLISGADWSPDSLGRFENLS